MIDLDLDAIEKRAASATAGAIDVHRYDDDPEIRYQLQSAKAPFRVLGYTHDGDGNVRAKFDAELFAHARADILALVARVRELGADTLESLALEIDRSGFMTFAEACESIQDDIAVGLERNGSWALDPSLEEWRRDHGELAVKVDAFITAKRVARGVAP